MSAKCHEISAKINTMQNTKLVLFVRSQFDMQMVTALL